MLEDFFSANYFFLLMGFDIDLLSFKIWYVGQRFWASLWGFKFTKTI